MAFGRLDVFWPDGRFETYLVDNETTTVGRSSGCTIALDTDTISRYHFSLTANEISQLEIMDMDSANGTFVDGVRLETNAHRIMYGGEEIQIGHLRMTFHRTDSAPTAIMDMIDEDTQQFKREDLNFYVEVSGPQIAVPPGSYTSVELRIVNSESSPRRFTVSTAGLPKGWARANRTELEVPEKSSATVLINVKPFIHSDSKPGEYLLQMTVALADQPDAPVQAETHVQILPHIGMGMALAANTIKGREPFRLHLHNQSSIGMPITLMGRSLDESLRFSLPQPQMILAPGQRLVAQGQIIPLRRRVLGMRIDRKFHIMLRSRDEASFLAVVPGTYEDIPLLSRWTLLGMGLIATTLIALAFFAILLISQATSPPEILSFSAQSRTITRGETLILDWDVTDTNSINILIDGELAAEGVPATTKRVEIDTSNYSDEIIISLNAIQDERMATTSLTVEIVAPLVIDVFEIEPTALARNVIQTLNGRWIVRGATETRVEGLSALGPVVVETSYGPEGSFEVSGLPTETFAVILVASDDKGNTITQSVDIVLFDPVCTTITDNLNLFVAPNETANVVSTLGLGQAMVVDARSQDGNWLRMTREGIVTWGQASGLRCEESFDPADLYVDPTTIQPIPEVVAPQAEATPEPTLETTP